MKEIIMRLKPAMREDHIAALHVRAEFPADGKKLLSLNRRVVNRNFPRLLASVQIMDDAGALPFRTEIRDRGQVETEEYQAERAPIGTIVVQYEGEITAALENPVFDLGYEADGMTGSGMVFFPAFPDGQYHYKIDWDLSDLPDGFSADWTMGTEAAGNGELLQQTFYAAGDLHTVRNGNFAFSWLGSPEADFPTLAGWTGNLFRRMADFFGDDGAPYHIFARNVSCRRCGGTALARSYLFLYQEEHLAGLDDVKLLFAHEMVHNWPAIADEPFGTGTWYMEGTAEYYSLLLPWRAGLISSERAAEVLNRRGADYYENPRISADNLTCGRLFPADSEATLIPYGRGMFYLMRVDAILRERSGISVDDIVRSLLEKSSRGEACDNETWLTLLQQAVPMDWRTDFEAMLAGAVQEPRLDMFEGRIAAERKAGTQRHTGIPCDTWNFYASNPAAKEQDRHHEI